MTYHVPACVMCNKLRCSLCSLERFRVGCKEQEQALYTWCKNAALRKDAALFKDAALLGLTTTEPDLLQPPDLRDVTTTITRTTPGPDPTHNQERPLSAAIPDQVTSQSLNRHSLHGQVDTPTSPTVEPRKEFDCPSLPLNQTGTIDIIPDPSHVASSIPKQNPDWPTTLPREADTIDRIIVAFNRWRAEGSNASNNFSSPTNVRLPNNSQSYHSTTPQKCRKRTSDHGNPSKKSDAKRARVSTGGVAEAGKEDKRLLACPFWKKDSIRHRNCFRGVKRIRDVKQHLRRSHVQPVFCPRCGVEFGDEEAELRNHMRAIDQCENREFPEPDGITSLHQKELKKYSDRNADEVEQWYVIWDCLFLCGPDGKPPPPRPISPYVDQDLSEDVLTYREFSHHKGWRALANAGDHKIRDVAVRVDEELLQKCFDKVYSTWLAERRASSKQPWEESPLPLADTSTPNDRASSSDTTPIDHQPQEDNTTTLSDFAAGPDFEDNFFDPQIDGVFDSSMAMPSMDNDTAQAFPSIPLLTSDHGLEHKIEVATLDPTLISR